jgi:hypothetical protein
MRPLALFLSSLLTAVLAAPLRAAPPDAAALEGIPEHYAADPGAPAVTAASLLASERFWPYQVTLTKPWQPSEQAQPLAAGTRGVLIRVEEGSGRARIDFGRYGLYEVPVDATDLVADANRVRTGEREKTAANFVLAIGPRLLDAGAPALVAVPFREVTRHRVFLCVFADPGSKEFRELAKSLAPLRERSGLLTILFPQGQVPDAELFERLRDLGWPTAFVHDHLSEAYTRTLLPEPMPPFPTLLLQTDEGRVLFQDRWQAGLPFGLDPALDQALGSSAAAGPAGRTAAR